MVLRPHPFITAASILPTEILYFSNTVCIILDSEEYINVALEYPGLREEHSQVCFVMYKYSGLCEEYLCVAWVTGVDQGRQA